MDQLTRRTFLAGATAAGVSAALPGAATAARPGRVRVTRSEERVVVIGSGFGGGVTSLRLAQAGVNVLVLERGRWWRTGPNAEAFPHATTPDRRHLFHTTWPELGGNPLGLPAGMPPYVGLLEPVVGDGIVAVVPAGVGGGSLIYQGMTLQPSEQLFSAAFPAGVSYAEMDRVYFPRVARMLKVRTAPEALVNAAPYEAARRFGAGVRGAGFGLEKIPMPIDWDFALAELRGEMKPSYTNGDGALGVNNGGKSSVDVTYLAQGRATGRVRIATRHNVREIARTRSGAWKVSVDVTDDSGRVIQHKVITTKALFVNAGTVNTNRLLVGAAGRGTISDLPDALGRGYGTNADQIYVWTDLLRGFGATQGGPVVYGSKDWAARETANTVIQASLPPIGANLAGWQPLPSALLPGAGAVAAQLGEVVRKVAADLVGTLSGVKTPGLDVRSTMLVGFGMSDGRGKFTYDAASDKVELSFPRGGDAAVAAKIRSRLQAIAGPSSVLLNTNDVVNSTWHSLGGANIGDVTDLDGRVRGQKGLYVVDGAFMPGTTCACNPSMTIAAMAERALDRIVKRDVGKVI